MIFTRDFVTRENYWQIASLVTQKSLFTVTHALFLISYTLNREYRVAGNRYSRMLFTSEDRFHSNLNVQEQSTNMTSQCMYLALAWRHRLNYDDVTVPSQKMLCLAIRQWFSYVTSSLMKIIAGSPHPRQNDSSLEERVNSESIASVLSSRRVLRSISK